MYGDESAGLLAQIVVLQSLIWGHGSTRGRERRRGRNQSKQIQDYAHFQVCGKEAGGKSQHSCSLAWSHLGRHSIQVGLFMASQRSRIACGIRMRAVAMVMKFMAGRSSSRSSSICFRQRIRCSSGYTKLLEFESVIFGMLIALPVALIYYLVLALLNSWKILLVSWEIV
ncbi:hypothetical protein PVK06_034284 [Gossypium arboreum]|uniref:Uncharacterized protein n=1 Tax=Gossypium arboreum TaxID=29729 RepID=A0ABR0NDR9_GOSAR|nr:hypothetical protein PVK06_034284 [Gossypium arboreum]